MPQSSFTNSEEINTQDNPAAPPALAALITKAASKQTYYTIRFLADRERTANAYRAYAYFRWLDDMLDERLSQQEERIAFVRCQQALVEAIYQGDWPHHLAPEEHILLDLIRSDREPAGGLQAYIHNMMAVMAFDAERRGRLISQQELDDYTRYLAIAVTEALHYFIGHDQYTPHDETRYLAVAAAHITHMLRDTCEDIVAGYYNIPREFLTKHSIAPWEVTSKAYREWVQSQVQLARDYFRAGKNYLAQVESWRCRLAGFAYVARFEAVLDAIEREGYQLRPEYEERKSLRTAMGMGKSVLWLMLRNRPAPAGSSSAAPTYRRPSMA